MRLLKKILKYYWTQNILFLFRRAKEKSIIIQDLKRWQQILSHLPQNQTPESFLVTLFQTKPEFRNVFYFRLRKDPIRNHFIYALTHRYLYPPKEDLVISVSKDIGPGFFIQHGRSSGISVQEIGVNCWINQHVSIGHKMPNQLPPVLGNNVRVTSGAKIYGQIVIGDNAIIGANAVVLKNVPPNCTVAGVPAKIVKRDGFRVDEPL